MLMGLSGFELGVFVEYLLVVVVYFDVVVGCVFYEFYVFDDVVCLCGGIGFGDEEVVGEIVNGDVEVGFYVIVLGLVDGYIVGID